MGDGGGRGEGCLQEPVEMGRSGESGGDRHRLFLGMAGDDLLDVPDLERRTAGQHRVRHTRHRIDIGPRIEGLAGGLFGSHERRRARGHGHALLADHLFRHPEIGEQHAHRTIGHRIKQQVAGRHIAMNNLMTVQHIEGAAGLGTQAKGLDRVAGERLRSASEPASQ